MAKKIFIIAGEVSGDILGADLMKSIIKEDKNVCFFGVGGEEMQKIKGFHSLFDIKDIAVMGIVEVLKNLKIIKVRIREVVNKIIDVNPDLVITIDSPGFNMRVIKEVRKTLPNIKALHYVAPQVWAWKEKRAKKVAKLYDYLFCFFDFEVPYFTKYGLRTFAVGHTAIKNVVGNKSRFLKKYKLKATDNIITMLPGSRVQIAKRLLPIYKEVVEKLSLKLKNLKIVIPATSTSYDFLMEEIKSWKIKPLIIRTKSDRYDAFVASEAVLSISGTAVLEVAVAKTPVVVAYKLSPLSYMIAKHLVKIKNVSLPNIIMGRKVVPEFIQKECNVDNLVEATAKVVNNKKYRENSIKELENMRKKIIQKKAPSDIGAEIVLDILNDFL
ncbi:lipid-A-disaccharide synthase [bacterium]|nr:lipid-A-disaccharide synthase [bacterium]